MVTIKVDVYDATAPIPVKVKISGDNGYKTNFEEDQSFERDFNLPPGSYKIRINGQNGEYVDGEETKYGRTEMEVTCDSCDEGPDPSGVQKKSTAIYTKQFNLSVS